MALFLISLELPEQMNELSKGLKDIIIECLETLMDLCKGPCRIN